VRAIASQHPASAAARGRTPFAFAAFRLLLLSRGASFLGNAIAPIALAFAVLDITGSVTDLGLVVASRTLPQVFLVLFGGVVADRFPRTKVIVASNSLGAASQGVAAVLLITGHVNLWQLALIQAVNGSVTAFAFPAGAGLTPQTVPGDVLQPANALLRLVINASLIGGAAIGGLLVASVGPGWAIAVDAATFAFAAVCVSRIRLRTPEPAAAGGPPDHPHHPETIDEAAPRDSMVADLREGWREFVGRTWLWVVVLAFSFINAAESGSLGVVGPLVADDSIGRAAWGFVLSAVAVGMAGAALTALRVRPRRTLLVGMAGILGMVPFLVVLATHPTTPALVAAALLSGLGVETFGIYWDLSMQQHVPQQTLSRVYAYDMLGSLMFIPLGQVAAGPLVAAFGSQATLLAAAALIAVVTAATIAVPSVRRLERTDGRPVT
jgi:MFS family permease